MLFVWTAYCEQTSRSIDAGENKEINSTPPPTFGSPLTGKTTRVESASGSRRPFTCNWSVARAAGAERGNEQILVDCKKRG